MPPGVSDPHADDTSRLDGPSAVAPVDVAVAAGPALVRDVVSRALRARLGLRVVAFDADAGESSIDRLVELQPRLLLTDDRDSVSNGEAFIRRLHRALPSTKILVLTRWSHEHALRRFVRAGAYGIVPNRSGLASLLRVVEANCLGSASGPQSGAPESAKCPPVQRGEVVAPDVDRRLTRREWEVAELVAKGLRNRGIALRLNISVDTVKTHLNNSFRKLELDGRLALGTLVQRRVIPKRNVTSGA
jgi:DNA-binding NarL/FixJ family response regulator